MALQSSGQISLGDIANEMGVSLSNVSLFAYSSLNVNQNSTSKPDGSAPHSISEFYGYDHTAVGAGPGVVPFNISPFVGDPNEACNTKLRQVFKSGDPNSIFDGDFFYDDPDGLSPIFVSPEAPFASYFTSEMYKAVFEYSNKFGVTNSFVQPCK